MATLLLLLWACAGGAPTDTADDKPVDTDTAGAGDDADGDGTADADDCAPDDATVHPGADELCNEVDDDCDGSVDEDAVDASTYYADVDGDTFGDPATSTLLCGNEAGWSLDDHDCDDTDAAIHPGADELCDDVDNDCDTQVDEDAVDAITRYADADGDGYGDDAAARTSCEDPGYADEAGDCDDADPAVHPGADELCDDAGVDEDCDGLVNGDDDSVVGGATWYYDADLDGYGDPATTGVSCADPGTYWVDNGDDCAVDDATVSPGATELCGDGLDQDCSGLADDGC